MCQIYNSGLCCLVGTPLDTVVQHHTTYWLAHSMPINWTKGFMQSWRTMSHFKPWPFLLKHAPWSLSPISLLGMAHKMSNCGIWYVHHIINVVQGQYTIFLRQIVLEFFLHLKWKKSSLLFF